MPEDLQLPLYRQVASRILNDIKNGTYAATLPPQDELTKVYSVGRSTIREAMRLLDDQGIIEVRHGSSTRVLSVETAPKIHPGLESFFGVSKLISAEGRRPGTSFLQIRRAYGSAHFFPAFNGEPVIVLERVRTSDDIPIVFSMDVFIDSNWALDDLEKNLRQNHSLVEWFESKNLGIHYAETTIRTQPVDPLIREHLRLFAHDYVLFLEEICYDKNGDIINCSYDYYHPRFTSFRVLRRTSDR